MEFKKAISIVLGLFVIVSFNGAMAYGPSAYNSTAGDTLDVFIAGSSSQNNILERLIRKVCAKNTLDIYRTAIQSVYFCRIYGPTCEYHYDSDLGDWNFVCGQVVQYFPVAGQKVAIHKTSIGGSGNGVQPVANQTNLNFIDMAAIKAGTITCTGSSTVADETVAGTTFARYTDHTGCGSTNGTRAAVPDVGISDVEPALVGASEAEIERLDISYQNAVVFGVPVTESLRNALQEVQGLTVGAEDEANMPSLSKAKLASIYSGGITDWSQIVSSTGAGLPSAVTGIAGGAVAPSNSQVYLCRRVQSAGAQAAFESHLLRQRCVAGVAPMLTGNDGGVVGAGTVNEGSATGNVISCLNTHDGANRWAVGMFSTENVESSVAATVNDGNGWRFIKVNGAAPTLLNITNGDYDFFTEQFMLWRNQITGNALAGLKLTLMSDIKNNAGSPSIIRALNAAFVHSWGDAGVMALITNGYVPTLPSAGDPVTEADVRVNPVLTSSRSPLGAPNNCQPPAIYLPVDVSSQF